MHVLHPDKIASLNQTLGKAPKPASPPIPAMPPKRTYDTRPNLVEALARRLHAANGGQPTP